MPLYGDSFDQLIKTLGALYEEPDLRRILSKLGEDLYRLAARDQKKDNLFSQLLRSLEQGDKLVPFLTEVEREYPKAKEVIQKAYAEAIPCDLQLTFTRRNRDGSWEALTAPGPNRRRLMRDMMPISMGVQEAQIWTGDIVRIEVLASDAGYLTAFNVGPSGNVHCLSTLDPAKPRTVAANARFVLCEVELTPPSGREIICATWSREPLSETCEELALLLDLVVPSISTRATRDMVSRESSISQLRHKGTWFITWELDHQRVTDG